MKKRISQLGQITLFHAVVNFYSGLTPQGQAVRLQPPVGTPTKHETWKRIEIFRTSKGGQNSFAGAVRTLVTLGLWLFFPVLEYVERWILDQGDQRRRMNMLL